MESPSVPKSSNLDIECLRCGARNIVENHVCGNCGASLPVIYDEEGNLFSWRGHPRWDETKNIKRLGLRPSAAPLAKGFLKVGVFIVLVLLVGMFFRGLLFNPLFLWGLILFFVSAVIWTIRHS